MDVEWQTYFIENIAGIGDLIMFIPTPQNQGTLSGLCAEHFDDGTNQPVPPGRHIDHVYCIRRGKFLGRYRPGYHFLQRDYAVFTTRQIAFAWMAYLELGAAPDRDL